MHFEFLIEDQSGKKAMDILAPKILGNGNTHRVHFYKGIGRIPKDLRPKMDASKRQLLNQLPKLLGGYGKTPNCGTIVVICDLDDRDKTEFMAELNGVLENCNPKPVTLFCIAVEEFEAWYLGDLDAIKKAYPRAKSAILNNYVHDSVCGTWELLAEATYEGGIKALRKRNWQEIGLQKSIWATNISPHMDVNTNRSPSFNYMHTKLKYCAGNS